MGQFGIKTYQSDSVMDFLQHFPEDGNLDDMDDMMAEETLDNVWASGTEFDRLGVAVWLITHGFTVKKSMMEEAMETRPNSKVVFVSGYAEEAFSDGLDDMPNAVFLAKPFSLVELAQKVKEQIES